MNDIFIRGLDLPLTINGVTVLDKDGNYNIYINVLLGYNAQNNAVKHELKHIKSEHFYDFEPVIYNELEADVI